MRDVTTDDLNRCKFILCNILTPEIKRNNITGGYGFIKPLSFKAKLNEAYLNSYLPYKYYFNSLSKFEQFYHANIEKYCDKLAQIRLENKSNLFKYNSEMEVVCDEY